jgi:mannose-6-phosphate isomerase-like protein (cupin superfamily)
MLRILSPRQYDRRNDQGASMSVIHEPRLGPMVGDPDDHRPHTEWALVFDPVDAHEPYVRDLTCIVERIAPGDAIPMHTHTIDELVVFTSGEGIYRLGADDTPVKTGSIVFVPAGVAHGTRNDGDGPLALYAMFGSRTLDITYLERNPAPGTEGLPAQPPMRFDPRHDTA